MELVEAVGGRSETGLVSAGEFSSSSRLLAAVAHGRHHRATDVRQRPAA